MTLGKHGLQNKIHYLFLLGQKDRRVPVSQGIHMAERLKQAGVSVRILMYPQDNHPLARVETQLDRWISTLDLFEKVSGWINNVKPKIRTIHSHSQPHIGTQYTIQRNHKIAWLISVRNSKISVTPPHTQHSLSISKLKKSKKYFFHKIGIEY